MRMYETVKRRRKKKKNRKLLARRDNSAQLSSISNKGFASKRQKSGSIGWSVRADEVSRAGVK